MKLTGGCYCGTVRYEAEGEPVLKAQCHCRECQYITGGGPNFFLAMPAEGFRYVQGTAKGFTRSDLDNPVTREFCPDCGTHLITRPRGMPMVVIKVGSLDDPKQFAGPDMAIFTIDRQPFHAIAPDLPSFERMPPL